jgi:hypothetical protein
MLSVMGFLRSTMALSGLVHTSAHALARKALQAVDSKANYCKTSGTCSPKSTVGPQAPNKQTLAILLRVKANDVAAESSCNSDSTHYAGTVALCSTILWTEVTVKDAAMLSVIESAGN